MADPFFKWVGSKRSLVPQLKELLPRDYAERRHVEPFVGGGALFFAMEPKQALLADRNEALITAYWILRSQPGPLLAAVQRRLKTHSEEQFYAQRAKFNKLLTTVRESTYMFSLAALFLYLNRTCFNGLYRVNQDDEFNVPVGSYKNPSIDAEAFREAARVLSKCAVRIECASFSSTLRGVMRGDFVYLDPPYDGTFAQYQKRGFDHTAQSILAERVFQLSKEPGVKLMVSGPDTPMIRKLYKFLDKTRVQASRSVGSRGDSRGKVTELVFRNY